MRIDITPNDKMWYDLKNLPDETWKNIAGFQYYMVSDYGRIKSLKRNTAHERIMRHHHGRDGYDYVILTENGINKTVKIHRVVASSFIDNTNDLPQVNHKDANKKNNYLENLEWCTASYNQLHAIAHGCCTFWMKGLTGKDCPFSKKVNQYTKNNEFIKTWDSMHDVTRALGIPVGNISLCCQGKKKSYGGYIWRYTKGGDV